MRIGMIIFSYKMLHLAATTLVFKMIEGKMYVINVNSKCYITLTNLFKDNFGFTVTLKTHSAKLIS